MKNFPKDVLDAIDRIEDLPVNRMLHVVRKLNDLLENVDDVAKAFEKSGNREMIDGARESRERIAAVARRLLDKVAERMKL